MSMLSKVGLPPVLLASLFGLCSCATPSVAGSNNNKSHILYEHRTPIQKTAIVEASKHGLLAAAGLNTDAVIDNAGEVSLGAAEIVKAIMGVAGFPYVIIPNIIKATVQGGAQYKEETANQEVSKLYYQDGMRKMRATLADRTQIEAEWDGLTPPPIAAEVKKVPTEIQS